MSGLAIPAGPGQVLTRTSEVSTALSPVLSRYDVIRMKPDETERQVRTTGELRFRFNETDFYFKLMPQDMRAPNYQAVVTGTGGVRRTLPPQPVHTFKGVLAGRKDIRARFNLNHSGVEGVVYAPGGWIYVEPLRNYLPSASSGELVVYRHADIKAAEALKCGVSVPKRLQLGMQQMRAQVETTTPGKYEFDIATEADYEYVQALGGPEQANREIEGILNLVDGVYQNELLLQLRITFQHAWDTVADPYTGKTVFDLMDEFRTYWNANFASTRDYDLAHFWTGATETFHQGVAYTGVACRHRPSSYGLSKHRGNHILDKYITPAHEIGHNFGASHPNEVLLREQTTSLQSCSTSIMWPGTVEGSGLTFCKLSREEIARHVSSNNSCMTLKPITLQPPSHLEITSSSFSQLSFSRIDLSWQDNSSNEAGFIVQRRRVGWSHWIEIKRTTANTTSVSSSGLFPGSTYIYRVQAFSGDGLSPFSNEVEATTAAGPSTEVHWKIEAVAGNGEVEPHPLVQIQRVGGYSGDGGPAVEARLNHPSGVAVDGLGNLYIADSWNHRIRRVDASGIITTIAGTGQAEASPILLDGWIGGYSGDGGPAVEARLNHPGGVAVDGLGYLYIADTWNHLIRRVDPSGTITTVAGSGSGTGADRFFNQGGYSGDGGRAVRARLHNPAAVAVDGEGNLYIADTDNHCVRRVDPTGIITTVAGIGRGGFWGDGGPAISALLQWPRGVAVDGAGNLYIADGGNDRIRRVDATGTITTVAGVGLGRSSRMDGPASMAVLDNPSGVAVDGPGNLYIADTLNHLIRRVDPRDIITTLAGGEISGYNRDNGPAYDALLDAPSGLAVDGPGNLYVADTYNHRVRVLTRPPRPPTRLTATAVSPYRVNLAWQDSSNDETGFIVQRRVGESPDWAEIGATAANTASFSDSGLDPATTYHYRVQAFDDGESSIFSNEASATTPQAVPPTVTDFVPTLGPVGTTVTVAGTNFLGAVAVRFNGVSTPRFEVVSGISIEAAVPPGASEGPISVVTPAGTAVSSESFNVTDSGISSRLFIPIVLRTQGRTPGSFFTSELTLTNRGTTTAGIHFTYTAAGGGGRGTAVDALGPGRQRVIPDAIDYLTSLGIPIEDNSARGTLLADFLNLSSPSDAGVTVRVGTPVREGRAGLAYPGIPHNEGFQEAVYLCGLRQSTQDRSNVALQHMGTPDDGPITLRTTVYSGEADSTRSRVLREVKLKPGHFRQYDEVLRELGSPAQGYVKVERVAGHAPFYAFAVINDNFNSDGSFVYPVAESSLVRTSGQTLPVILENRGFSSELTVTNFSASDKTIKFSFVADAVETGGGTATFSLRLKAGEQSILPEILEELRRKEVKGIGPAGPAFAGALFAIPVEGDLSGIVIGGRTGAPDQRGGQYSLFYNGVPYGSASVKTAWVYGLQQNRENRSNLALVNTGEIDDSSSTFEITVYDGTGNTPPRTKRVSLGPRRWRQKQGILGGIAQGYVEITKTSGNNPFVAYGVINDGGRPGERSGDGAFMLSRE